MKYSLENIGKNLRALRSQSGKSQRKVAAEIGIDFSNYQRLEGNPPPNMRIETLFKLLEYYDITLEELVK